MFLYNEPVHMRTRTEIILINIDALLQYAIIIIFLIVTTDFTLRVENTFSNAYASLSETRKVSQQLKTVFSGCTSAGHFNLNFAPVDASLNAESAPFTLAMITSLIVGILIIAGFHIVVDFIVKYLVTYNIRHIRVKGSVFPLHLIMALADVGLSVTIVAAIGASYSTRNFLSDYVNECSASLRATNMTLFIASDIDTDVVFSTNLIPLLVVHCLNIAMFGIETFMKFYIAWDPAEAALQKAKYPYYTKGLLATPIEPLLLEYTLLRAAKVEQLHKDLKNTNPVFMPHLTGQYLDDDGSNFTHQASQCLDDVEDAELRHTIVQAMAMASSTTGRELRVPRTFMAGADPNDANAQREFKNKASRQLAARRVAQIRAQEELDQQYRDAKARARQLQNKGLLPNTGDITQQGQAWDPEEEGEDHFYDPNFPVQPVPQPRNGNFANTTVYTSDPYGTQSQASHSQPVSPQLLAPSDKGSNFYIPTHTATNLEGSGSANGATNNNYTNSVSDAGGARPGSISAMNGGNNIFNNNLARQDTDSNDRESHAKRRDKKSKKHHHKQRSGDSFSSGGETPAGTSGQIFAYYDADGNLLGEGETLEGLDGEDYILEEYDEAGNLVASHVNTNGGELEDTHHSHHRSRSHSKEKRDKGDKKSKKEKRDKKDKRKDKKGKTSQTHSRSESASLVPTPSVRLDVPPRSPTTNVVLPPVPTGAATTVSASDAHPFLSTTSTIMGGGPRSIPAPTLDEDDEEPVAPPPATSRLTAAQNTQ